MAKIKVGFIGLGRMGITHLAILNSNPLVQIIAASDPSKVINILFKKYYENILLFDDYKKLIEKAKPDTLIISTPPNQHSEIIEYAIAKGIHIFCEKPFTLSAPEAARLADLADKKGIINQVGYVNRFNDMFVKAKIFIANNVIGEVVRFKSEMFSYTISKEDKGEGWRGSEESGGGCLNEMGSHAIDLVSYLVGAPDFVTGSVLSKVYSKKVDDIFSSTLVYHNGISGTIYVNWTDPSYRKPTNKIEIFGRKGKILVDQHDLRVFLKDPDSSNDLRKGWNTIYITNIFKSVPFYVRGNEFTAQLYYFIDCIKNDKRNTICSFRDASQTQKVLNMIRADFKQKGMSYGKN